MQTWIDLWPWTISKAESCRFRRSLLLILFSLSLATLLASPMSSSLRKRLADVEDPHLRRILTNSVNVGLITNVEELDQVLSRVQQKDSDAFPQGKELPEIYTYIKRHERALPETYRSLMATIRSLGLTNMEIYCGSHVVCRDGGQLYEKWAGLGAFPRVSSHYKGVGVQQFELRLDGIGALLFGKTGSGDTWFQMEAHSTSLTDAFPHLMDYFKHCLSNGDNVGPIGTTSRGEQAPIVIAPVRRNTRNR